MGDITKDFSYYEFRPHGTAKKWIPRSQYRRRLLNNLAKNLQIIRNEIPAGAYMKVTGGVRTLSDYDRLRKKGYNPSETSDHYCGSSVPLSYGSKKYKKYGETYNFAVGAADIVPKGMGVWDLFVLAATLTKKGECDFGQIIYEKSPNQDPAKVKEWVHFGGSLKGIFSNAIIKLVARSQFMKTTNGGKSYIAVTNI
jgi:hypothetical protein